MAHTAFFDMTTDGGRLYIFQNGGGTLREARDIAIGEDGSLSVGDLPEDIYDTYLSLPLGMLDFRMLELPLDDPARIREILPFELEGLVLGGIGNVVLDAMVLGKAGDNHLVLAVYIKKDVLKRHLDALASLGLDPKVVTSLELAHAVEASGGEREALSKMFLSPPEISVAERTPRAFDAMGNPPVEFRRGEFAYTRDVRRAQRAMGLAMGALALLVLVVAGDIALRTTGARNEAAALEQRIVETYAEMFPGEKLSGTSGLAYKLKARIKDVQERDQVLRGVDLLEFQMDLKKATPEGVVYKEITLDREYIVLKGEAPSLSVVEEVKRKLESFLSEVKITESGPAASGNYAFSIAAKEVLK